MIICFDMKSTVVQLLSKEQKVQECDARDDDQGYVAGNKKLNLIY